MKNKSPVTFVDRGDHVDVFISMAPAEKKKCRRCGGELFGGEIDFGVCDLCSDGENEE